MVWITGGGGMLGRHISEKFAAAGIPFISTDIDLDITKKDEILGFISDKNINWVIICSAYTAVDLAEDEREKAFAVNALGVKNIAEVLNGSKARIVHFSTDYIFPGSCRSGYSEDDEPGPSSVYGQSKLEGERYLVSLYNEYFIFRISWLYGPYGKNFVHTMISLFKERDELNVVNDQFGSPTYTGELADFITVLVESGSEKYGVYHFSGEGSTCWHEFASEIYRLSLKYGIIDRDVKINPVDSSKYPVKAKRPAYSYMIKDRLIETFGYRPKDWRVTLEEYIRSTR